MSQFEGDELDLLDAYAAFVEKLVNNPHIGYMVWSDKALMEEYERLTKFQ